MLDSQGKLENVQDPNSNQIMRVDVGISTKKRLICIPNKQETKDAGAIDES